MSVIQSTTLSKASFIVHKHLKTWAIRLKYIQDDQIMKGNKTLLIDASENEEKNHKHEWSGLHEVSKDIGTNLFLGHSCGPL